MSKRHTPLKTSGLRKSNVATRSGKSSSHDTRDVSKGSTQRTNSTARLLKMYNSKPDRKKMREAPKEAMVRIEPGRKWFNNTRIVTQENLAQFRETLAKARNNPRSVLVKSTKLPISLFDHSAESKKKRASNLLSVSPFAETFSATRRQKQARLENGDDLLSLITDVQSKNDEYHLLKDSALVEELKVGGGGSGGSGGCAPPVEAVMLKGTSRRIWGELYKVVDSSDILIQVLDVRDPMGTRCFHLEKHLRKDRPFKKLILLLNKCDLVPSWVTEKWIKILSQEFPVVAFKASLLHPFGKRSLIGLLRQYSEMMKNRKHVSVGLIGYPNVGKSSVINTLRGKKVCTSAPIPGQTKVWQYVDLTNKVYLIDCPGIVAEAADGGMGGGGGGGSGGGGGGSGGGGGGGEDTTPPLSFTGDEYRVIRGVVRAERLECPEDYVDTILRLVDWRKFTKFYKLDLDEKPGSGHDVVEILARKWGKLGKGGEPNTTPVAIRIIQDLQRGKLPWFIPPPKQPGEKEEEEGRPEVEVVVSEEEEDEEEQGGPSEEDEEDEEGHSSEEEEGEPSASASASE